MNSQTKFDSLIKTLLESNIDFPREELAPDVWDTIDKSITLKKEVKAKIIETLKKFTEFDLYAIIQNIRVIGSITSNKYTDETDLDVHLTIDTEKIPEGYDPESFRDYVKDWFDDNRDSIDAKINEHPIEVYIQLDYWRDFASDAVYDFDSDIWLVHPQLVSLDYDPYQIYSTIFDEVRETAAQIDITIGDVKRNVKDYQVMKDAIKFLDINQRRILSQKLREKVVEIKQDIDQLIKIKDVLKDKRNLASAPASKEDALKVKSDEEWIKNNIIFKSIARYGYFDIIKALKDLTEDKPITDVQVDQIEKTII